MGRLINFETSWRNLRLKRCPERTGGPWIERQFFGIQPGPRGEWTVCVAWQDDDGDWPVSMSTIEPAKFFIGSCWEKTIKR